MSKVIVVGSINMDCVTRVERIPAPGETVLGSELTHFPGGKGANQAVAAARLGADTMLVGKMGKDDYGCKLASFLENQRINMEHVSVNSDHATGVAIVTVAQSGENVITVISGSNAFVDTACVNPTMFHKGDIVLLQNEIPNETNVYAAKLAKEAGAITVYNPAPAHDVSSVLLQSPEYLVVNETELAFYTSNKDTTMEDAALSLCNAHQVLLVTLGAKGCWVVQNNTITLIPALPVQVIDTTGAGDCFVGAFASRLAQGEEVGNAARFATKAAAVSVQKMGAGIGMPFLDEII